MRIVIYIICCSLIACSQAPTPITSTGPKTYLMFDYRIEGSDQPIPKEGCKLYLMNQTLNEEQSVLISRENKTVLAELPPGRYKAEKLNCRLTKNWQLKNVFAQGFNVDNGRINYAGILILNFSNEDLESIRLGDRKDNLETLKNILSDLSSEEQSRLVSAYTSKTITSEMLEREKAGGIVLKAKGLKIEKLLPLNEELKKCNQQALKFDPVLIGELSIKAHYQNGQLKNIQNLSSHALPGSFESCVQDNLKKFNAHANSDFELQMTF